MSSHEAEPFEPPREPIHRLTAPIERFLHVEAASGLVLLACTLVALIVANSAWGPGYLAFWDTKLAIGVGNSELSLSLKHWVDDALMAVFFFLIGLEVKREMVLGELRDMRRAALPIVAALGGMLAPAGIYLALQHDGPARDGWGIPMATDIAFVVGCMALMSSRVPRSLRVLLLSLAIADDIGAIIVIAVGYTAEIHMIALALAFAGLALVFVLARLGVRSFAVYTVIGALVWLALHESGVHATLAGVCLGLLTPARSYMAPGRIGILLERAGRVLQGEGWHSIEHRADRVRDYRWAAREAVSPLEYLERVLHPWVGFVIMPLFALANAGVVFHFADVGDPIALAVAAGLVVGKPLGIVICCWIAVRAGLARLPQEFGWSVLAGGGCLAGIGFTMALFIANLALKSPMLENAKVGILAGSALAALLGMLLLWKLLPEPAPDAAESARRPEGPGV